MSTSFDVYVLTDSWGSTWVYTDKKEAKENFDACVKLNVKDYEEQGRKVKVEKYYDKCPWNFNADARITDAKDGHLLETIRVGRPMNGQSIKVFSNKDIELSTFHTSYGPAIEVKFA